jgi:CheY-like chemotaxis protein
VASTSHRHVVLVVDGDHATRFALIGYLQRAGFEVAGVAGTHRVLAMLGTGFTPCAVVIDVRVHGETGWALAWRLRQTPATPAVPVILISDVAEDAPRAIRVGARQFLSKPAAPAEIAASIGEFCPRT